MLSPKSTNFRAIQFFMATAFFFISVLNANAQLRNTNAQQAVSCIQGTVSASPATVCAGSSTTLTATPASLSNCFSSSLITAGNINYQYSSTFVDNNQNVYFSGAYTGSVNVAGQSLPAIGNRDFFMAKYSACGAEGWAIYGSSSNNDQLGNDGGKAIAVDNLGNTYIVGRYNANSIIFSSTGSRFVPQSYVSNNGFPNAQDGFLIKVNSSGVIEWGVTIYGGSNDGFNGLTVDGDGNPIVTAVYNANPITGGVTINDINGSSFIGAGNITGSTAALIKFNTIGDMQWITKVYNKDAVASSVVADGSSIYFTGWYNAATNGASLQVLDASNTTSSITSSGFGNGYLIKLNNNGNLQWGKTIGNGGDATNSLAFINDVTVDGAGNPWIVGYYTGNGDRSAFGDMPNESSNIYGLIAQYDASGNAVFTKSRQQSATDTRYYGIAVNGNTVAACGNFRGDTGGFNDILLVTYDNNGNIIRDITGGTNNADDIAYCVRPFRYGFMISGANGAGATIPAGGATASNVGSFLWNTTGGTITSTVSWTDMSGNSISGNPITTASLTANTTYYCTFDDGYTTCTASLDVVVNQPVRTVTTITICSGDTYVDPGSNNQYSVAGSYEINLIGSNGCDSISTVNIRLLPLSYSTTNTTICSNQLPYSWNTINCPSEGIYTDTLIAANGCDSIVTLNLSVTPTTSSDETVVACINYNWNGNDYSTSGTFTFTTPNANGCDSTATLYLTITPQPEQPTLACYETATFNTTTCSWDVTGTQPAAPTGLACYETANFNTSTCVWDVTGTQPEQPTLACYETATFNTSSCSWDVTGTQPALPNLACYETATFNTSSCSWDVTGTQPELPTLACYETATFNTTTCTWDVTGTQPELPTLACYETATFNTTTCTWDVTGTQPELPTLACYETATFNTTTCTWDVTGTQPELPTLACYETATFNTTTCSWDVTGTQPELPTLACYETATFNTTTCTWDVTGTQPELPTLACYETATFNTTTCTWDVTGTQPELPTLACYETATFNTTTCTWDVTGTQPELPTLACYETATFNTTTCTWDVTGTQPELPTLACYETATFNTTTCTWDVTGTQPELPTLACYETATFNTTTCSWDVTGTQPDLPTLACYETATFNTTTCTWDVTGTQPELPTLACYETATFNTTTCSWDVTGTQPELPTLACYETATFNTSSCSWDVTGTQPAIPTLACYETATFNTTTCSWEVTGTQPELPTLACYETATFNTTTCVWDVTGTQPELPTLACYETATFNTTTCTWDVTGTQPASTTQVTICSNQLPYSWNSNSYPTGGTYNVTLQSASGCDSIATLILNVTQVAIGIVYDTACSNQLPYVWNQLRLFVPGTYSVFLAGSNGCDSIARLFLTIANPTSSTTNVTVCTNQLPYQWNGNNYNSSGTYTATLINAFGCDSLATLNLTINSTSSSTINVAVCANQLPYQWNGNTYGASGTYTFTTTGNNGCDELNILNLTINPIPDAPQVSVTQPTCTIATGCIDIVNPVLGVDYSPYPSCGLAPGNYAVTGTQNGCTSAPTSVTINPQPTAPSRPIITGPSNICQYIGTNESVCYTITNYNPANQYAITLLPTGAVITSPINANGVFCVSFQNTPVGGSTTQIRVVATNGCGNSPIGFVILIRNRPPSTPGTISRSSTNICESIVNGTPITYSISPVQGATNYCWTVPVGATIVNSTSTPYCGAGLTSIEVVYNSNFAGGQIGVSAGNACGNSSYRIRTINAITIAAPITLSVVQPTCTVSTATITVTAPVGNGYQYSLDGNFNTPRRNNVFTGVTPGIHTITVSNNSVCFVNSDTTIVINPQPTVSVVDTIEGPKNICQYIGTGETIRYTAGISNASGNLQYNWNRLPIPGIELVEGGGLTDDFIVVRFLSPFIPSVDQRITLTVTNECGTSNLFIKYLAAQPPVTPGFITPSSTDICSAISTGSSITYCVEPVIAATSYEWTLPAGTTVVGANNENCITLTFDPSYTDANICVRAINNCGPSGGQRCYTISRNLASIPGLITGPTIGCTHVAPNGTPAVYTVNNVPGVTYNWVFVSNCGAPIAIPGNTNTASILFPTTYCGGTMQVTATNGCGTSGVRNLVVPARAIARTPVISITQTDCQSGTGSVSVTSPVGAGYIYTLTQDGAADQISTTPSFSGLTPGNYQVYAINNDLCLSAAFTAFTIDPLPALNPIITASGPTTFCEGGSVTLDANTGNANDTYLWTPGGAITSNITVTSSGTYTVTVTTSAGCVGSASEVVTVNPIYNTTINEVICDGQSFTTSWGEIVTTAGTYCNTFSSVNGCDSIECVVLTVNPIYNTTIIEAICEGQSFITSWGVVLTTAGTYCNTFSSVNGCDSIECVVLTVNPIYNTTITEAICEGQSFTTSWGVVLTTAGTYCNTFSTVNGCDSIECVELTVNPLPVPSITLYGANPICQGSTDRLVASPSGPGYTYSWSNGEVTPEIYVDATGTFTVTVTNQFGCSATSESITIVVNPLPEPVVTSSGPLTICNGNPVTLTATGGTPNSNYVWNTIPRTRPSFGTSLVVTTPGSYVITITNNPTGCNGSDTVVISTGTATSSTTEAAACVSYEWNNNIYTATGTYVFQTTNSTGCDSTATLNLTITPQPELPTLACYETATFNATTCSWDVTGTQPEAPTGLACYETATFNTTTCTWDVTGTQPELPTLACYETATFNTTTCTWDVTGTQPEAPTGLACYETATFNTTTCTWDVTGTQPELPTLACYETATFNTTTCTWDVTGTQPELPTLACYETATFNTTTCTWDVTGTQPELPTLACYETATFNTTTCTWDVTGTQPELPTLACYETATFNTTTCTWDVTGTQPELPTLACYETATFNTTTCTWDVTGTQPELPTLACYETATFNTTTCSWDVTGTQPELPTLACYETATFNTSSCSWDVTGTQPELPTLACYETATFNTTTCTWDVTGTQPELPTLACYETATFNTTTCSWDVTGTQPELPTLACYETATFNTSSCSWDVTGTQPELPTLACYETATFNTTTCSWVVTGTQPELPTLACYETATFNTTTCVWDVTGTQPQLPTLACYETATFNTTTCSWDVTGTQPDAPTLACYETATFNTTTCVWDVTGTQPELPTLACYETAIFNTTTCTWDVTGTQPDAPTGLACYETATFNTTTCVWDVTGTEPDPISINVSTCDSYYWSLSGQLYSTSGSYTFSITNSVGCDSVYVLNLNLNLSSSSTTDVTVCANELPYLWNGTNYNTNGTYEFQTINAVGCDSTAILNLTVRQSPVVSGLTGPSNICTYVGTGELVTYSLIDPLPTVRYSWTVTPGIDIVTDLSNNPSSIQVTFASTIGASNAQIRVVASDSCNQTSQIFVYYLASRVLVAPAFTSNPNTNICTSIVNQAGVTYTINPIVGADSYSWNFENTDGSPVTGVTITELDGIPVTTLTTFANLDRVSYTSITLQYDASFIAGNLMVFGNNGCGAGNVRSFPISKPQKTVTFVSGAITNVCNYLGLPDGTPGANICYNAVINGVGESWTWTYPAGFNVIGISTSADGSSSSLCGWFAAGYTGGVISPIVIYNCGTATTSITITASAPTAPLDIAGPTAVCNYVASTGNSASYTVTEVADATSYVWSVPDGCNIIAGQGSNTINVVFPDNFAGGDISVIAENNCGISSASSLVIDPCDNSTGGKLSNPVTQSAGLENINVKVFPNPTVNEFRMNVNTTGKEQITVRIWDAQGKMLKIMKMMPFETIKFGNELKTGAYMVEVLQGNKKITQRVIKF